MELTKENIATLLNKHPLLIDRAIEIIGANQTADELGSRHTLFGWQASEEWTHLAQAFHA